MTPLLVEQVADVHDVYCQLNAVHLSCNLERELLSEVNVKVLLESEVVGVTLVEFAAVLAKIRVAFNPSLHQLALHVGCEFRSLAIV